MPLFNPAADVRRAVFCIVMGSEDCMDAFEKLLRLPLKVSRLVLSLSSTHPPHPPHPTGSFPVIHWSLCAALCGCWNVTARAGFAPCC